MTDFMNGFTALAMNLLAILDFNISYEVTANSILVILISIVTMSVCFSIIGILNICEMIANKKYAKYRQIYLSNNSVLK